MKSTCFYVISVFIIIGIASCQKGSLKPIAQANLSAVLPVDTTRRLSNVVILGSSSAFGTGCKPIDSAWAYKLSNVSKNVVVTNLAVNGNVTYLTMPSSDRTDSRPLPDTAHNISKAITLHPALVLISLPTNDIAYGYSDNEIIKNYARMSSCLDSAKISYLIFGTQPRDFTSVITRARLKSLNEKLKAIYASNYFDFLENVSTATYEIRPEFSYGDGIHLNNKGHALIFRGLMAKQMIKDIIK